MKLCLIFLYFYFFQLFSPTTSAGIARRRKTDKIGRGLRHFSMKVCEKVKEKGVTTYNEVADELVAEVSQFLIKNI